MIWLAISLSLLIPLLLLVYASCSISSGVYLKAVCRLDTHEKAVALTYDDGPDPIATLPLLEVLKRYDAKASFFCIGEKAEQFPAIVRRIVEEGHLIGNHSYSHKSCFPLYSRRKIADELMRTRQILEKISGRRLPLFRPPFGVTNPAVGRVVKELGLTTVGWSVRSFDTQASTAEKVLRRIKRKLKPGVIILLHDRMPFAAELTENLLIYLRDNGYKVVPLTPENKLYE